MRPAKINFPPRLILAVVTGAWLASSLIAAEAPPPASPPTPVQSIEGAKKEFEALKAAREAAERGQGSALPRVPVPELQTGLGEPRPTQGARANPAVDLAKKKTDNWLLDGMNREVGRRDGEGRHSPHPHVRDRGAKSIASDEAGSPIEASASDPRNEPASARESRSTARSNREKSAEAPNPLDRYLAEWMTPRDYATLKPSITEGLSTHGTGLGAGSLSATFGEDLSGATLPGGMTLPGVHALEAGPKAATISPPRENPYLQSFALPPAPATSLPSASPPSAPFPAAPVVSSMPPPAPAAPAAKPPVPDFARPMQDEKYFKQLKRF